jgi:excisionase family DNA binding protein
MEGSLRSYLTAKELATHVRLKPRTLLRWARLGIIPAIRVTPRVVRFDLAAVQQAIAERALEDRSDADVRQ